MRILSDTLQPLRPVLAATLSDETLAFVRENGRGMVASPSLRGTTAGQTSIIWNGINVNSPLTGQVDLNNWLWQPGDRWVLRMGGGSVLFGSGAIGGSLHLENSPAFDTPWEQRFDISYGSYDTRLIAFRQNGGGSKWKLRWGITAQDSDNDYPIVHTDLRNENGGYKSFTWNLNAGHQLSRTTTLNVYHMGNIGDRQLSGTLLAPSNSRYKDAFSRTQLSLDSGGDRYETVLRLAHLYEEYTFWMSDSGVSTGDGRVHTLLGRYEGTLEWGKGWTWQHFLQGQQLSARGLNIAGRGRLDVALSSLLRFERRGTRLSASLRKDWTSEFNGPLLFAVQGQQRIAPGWSLKGNFSRNFRIPSLNDLYWVPGGNPNLRPERSVQWEAGLLGSSKRVTWESQLYWIRSRDLIRWLPGADPEIWSPVNTDRVWIQGWETSLTGRLIHRDKNGLSATARYGLIRSIDRSTGEQMAYTPRHQARFRLDWRYRSLRLFLRQVYTGSVRTNGATPLEPWIRFDAGLYWNPDIQGTVRYTLGLQLRNLYNQYYEWVAFRPMPGRNLTSQLTLNF